MVGKQKKFTLNKVKQGKDKITMMEAETWNRVQIRNSAAVYKCKEEKIQVYSRMNCYMS